MGGKLPGRSRGGLRFCVGLTFSVGMEFSGESVET